MRGLDSKSLYIIYSKKGKNKEVSGNSFQNSFDIRDYWDAQYRFKK
jgi:hypothetical protein